MLFGKEEEKLVEPESPIDKMFSEAELKTILKKVMDTRKVYNDNTVTYSDVDWTKNEKNYIIIAEHISLEDLKKLAKSNCKMCNGKGYHIEHLDKAKIPNPEDYIILSSKPMDNLTEDQRKQLVEEEKQRKHWRVMLPCKCGIKELVKKENYIVSNALGNIVIKMTYKEKA